MDFPGPAFRLPPPSPSSESVTGTRKERDERLARALGFFDPDLDPVNRVPREEERARDEQAAPQRGPATLAAKAAPTAQALRSPAPKGRPSGVQREMTPPPSDAEKGRLVQATARVDGDVEKISAQDSGEATASRQQDEAASETGKAGRNKKLLGLFNGRHRAK